MSHHPLDHIEWVAAKDLKANHWNPNTVFEPELRLLERSILKLGWSQPILVTPDLTIIDGFHRWRLAQDSERIRMRDGGLVPVCKLDVSEAEARLLTVRMNRAKGDHGAVQMREIVRELVDVYDLDLQEVAREIGATTEEVELLYSGTVFKTLKLKDYRYSEAWEPK